MSMTFSPSHKPTLRCAPKTTIFMNCILELESVQRKRDACSCSRESSPAAFAGPSPAGGSFPELIVQPDPVGPRRTAMPDYREAVGRVVEILVDGVVLIGKVCAISLYVPRVT